MADDDLPPFRFERVAIIGIGLIGSSLAQALRANGFTGSIAVGDRNGDALRVAAEMKLADTFHVAAGKAVANADLVVMCVPVGQMGAIARAIAPTLAANAVVTDVGSVKGAVAAAVRPILGRRFVPAHPIAGTEQSGPRAGFPTLFQRRWCILTPEADTDPAALQAVADMWRRLGSDIEVMDIARHDQVLAITSHLPHLIAYNLVRTAADMEAVSEQEVIKFSAGGFRDSTRLAASDPTMWRDVFLTNKAAVLETLGRFSEDLAMLQRAIRWGDGELLFDVFERTRAVRLGIVGAGQDTAAPDFGRPRTHAEVDADDAEKPSFAGARAR